MSHDFSVEDGVLSNNSAGMGLPRYTSDAVALNIIRFWSTREGSSSSHRCVHSTPSCTLAMARLDSVELARDLFYENAPVLEPFRASVLMLLSVRRILKVVEKRTGL
jgi:hypothetical protein